MMCPIQLTYCIWSWLTGMKEYGPSVSRGWINCAIQWSVWIDCLRLVGVWKISWSWFLLTQLLHVSKVKLKITEDRMSVESEMRWQYVTSTPSQSESTSNIIKQYFKHSDICDKRFGCCKPSNRGSQTRSSQHPPNLKASVNWIFPAGLWAWCPELVP